MHVVNASWKKPLNHGQDLLSWPAQKLHLSMINRYYVSYVIYRLYVDFTCQLSFVVGSGLRQHLVPRLHLSQLRLQLAAPRRQLTRLLQGARRGRTARAHGGRRRRRPWRRPRAPELQLDGELAHLSQGYTPRDVQLRRPPRTAGSCGKDLYDKP